jgi:cell division ATPase FtsA
LIHEYVESENAGLKSYKKVSNNILNKIVYSRTEEIIDFINKELAFFQKQNQIFNKILISGEGSKIKGFYDLLSEKIKIKYLSIEKFSSKLKNDLEDDYDVCISVINYIKNSYSKEIPSSTKENKSIFDKVLSLFN